MGETTSRRTDSERRARQSQRMARLFRVLELIQAKGIRNAAAIARELGCSERTIYRDLNTLEAAGVPWYFHAESGSYRVRDWYSKPTFRPAREDSNPSGDETAKHILKFLASDDLGTLLSEARALVDAIERIRKLALDPPAP